MSGYTGPNHEGKQLNVTNNIVQMKLGDIKKTRFYNDPNSAHPIRASHTYPWTTFSRPQSGWKDK